LFVFKRRGCIRFLFYSRRSSLLLAFFFFYAYRRIEIMSAFFRALPHLFRSLSSFNPRVARRDFSDMNNARPCDEYLNTGTTSLSSHAGLGLIILVRSLSKIIQLGRERELLRLNWRNANVHIANTSLPLQTSFNLPFPHYFREKRISRCIYCAFYLNAKTSY